MRRAELTRALGGNKRLVREFEAQAEDVEDNSEVTTAIVESTGRLEDATVLTLSANAALQNERVIALGKGLRGRDDGSTFTVSFSVSVPEVSGGFSMNMVVEGDATLRFPLTGRVATLDNNEKFSNKKYDAPVLTGLGDYADNAAAAAAGVLVGGVYRNGNDLKIRT